MFKCGAVKTGAREKADTLVARRPAPDVVAESRLQRMAFKCRNSKRCSRSHAREKLPRGANRQRRGSGYELLNDRVHAAQCAPRARFSKDAVKKLRATMNSAPTPYSCATLKQPPPNGDVAILRLGICAARTGMIR